MNLCERKYLILKNPTVKSCNVKIKLELNHVSGVLICARVVPLL